MGHPGTPIWTWTLCVLLMCAGQAVAGVQYMVATPAILESAEMTKICSSILQPNETLGLTISLLHNEKKVPIIQVQAGPSEDIHSCIEFMVPEVQKDEVGMMEVELRGDTFHSKEERKVMIRVYKPSTFIQSDKPIYLPGQTVNFRVVTLDSKLRPASQLYSIIELEDPQRNRIGQWLNSSSDGHILQLSYSLNSECAEGNYKISVQTDGSKIQHSFKVEKYVLPKFEVKINSADEVSIGQDEVTAEVCAKYTYGQPVPGSVMVELCRPFHRYLYTTNIINLDDLHRVPGMVPPCLIEREQTDKKGCATFTFKMSNFTRIDSKAMQDQLVLKTKMEEEGTGIAMNKENNIKISHVIGKLSFADTPSIYEKGENLTGKVKAVHYNNTPIADMSVYLFEGETWSPRLLQNLTTDSDGMADFSLSTEQFEGNIRLHVSTSSKLEYAPYRMAHYESGEHRISLSQVSSPDVKTVSTLEVNKKKDGSLRCDEEEEVSVKYTVVGEAPGSVSIMYLILARGVIVMQGVEKFEVEDKSVNEGEVSLKFKVSPNMAPDVQIVAYAVLPSENVVAHSADFSTEKCFSHKVDLEFSPSLAVPGEETTMNMKAHPGSLCGLSAVDQSVLIQEPGKTLNAEKIFDLLPVKKISHIPYGVEDPSPCLLVRPKRYAVPHPVERDDAHTVFQNVGLKMATNLFIRMPSCLQFKGRQYHLGHGYVYPVAMEYEITRQSTRVGVGMMPNIAMASPGGFGSAANDVSPIETVRTFFPETWIWDLVEVGSSGSKEVKFTVPDTITTWETEAFCLSPEGFGLAPRKEITVFQPFFLELSLPYSIIRGEHFQLKATVFNYQSNCIMVTVTPTTSPDYVLTQIPGDQYSSCLCGNERKSFKWAFAAVGLGVMNVSVTAEAVASHASCDNEIVKVPDRGRIDVVTRSLIVKAEGTEKMEAYNSLLCPKGEVLTEEIDTQIPDDVIKGSARASVSVLGDIMGRALKNLDGMLRMPYGCGEQNMALLAPNIYILQYLKNTNQLTPAISEKATRFLKSGYQRQLNYKHHNGAYSTFGSGPGNTWLTAFVVRSFTKAQSFIYIDPAKIEESKTWLENKQQENGCFQKLGNLFNNRMKGGVSDEVTLSAYITASFLEMNVSADDPVVNKSLSCLRESLSNFSNTYTTALLAYVFTLAGDTEARTRLLTHLDLVAVNQGGFLHWDHTADSLSVEISSYVILAKLSAAPSAEDMGYATRIVRWLTGQQNYYGGFSSTQDTVVALQALALYASLVDSSGGSSTVTVQSPSGELKFKVNQDNRLLYQEKDLKDIGGKYTLKAEGSTCASVQISLHYNIPTPLNASALSVDVSTDAKCDHVSQRPKMTLNLKSIYNGEETSTNMVILDIKMLSGFVPDPESLKRLKGPHTTRVDLKDDHVLLYITELEKSITYTHSLELIQEHAVANLKPAVIKLYDYYQPSDNVEAKYIYSCVTA